MTAPAACRQTDVLSPKSPLWVIRVRVRPAAAPAMSVMPRKRRSATKMRSVAMGQEATYAPQQKLILFDHLIGADEKIRRDF
jgi:hypothetical protein